MNKYLLTGAAVILIMVAGGAWWYLNRPVMPAVSEAVQFSTEQATQQNTNAQAPQPALGRADATADWKLFVNLRDGYSVKYPENGGEPSTDSPSWLASYGFRTSVTFIRYGGWADIYIFDGPADAAIAAHEKINRGYSPYTVSTEDMLIGGKSGKVVNWAENADPTARINHSYFVEYKPGKTLYIVGLPEFVSTIKFLSATEPGVAIDRTSILTASSQTTITGTAAGVGRVRVAVWASAPARSTGWGQAASGVVPVVDGRWSFKTTENNTMGGKLSPGVYKVEASAVDEAGNVIGTTISGTLTVIQ